MTPLFIPFLLYPLPPPTLAYSSFSSFPCLFLFLLFPLFIPLSPLFFVYSSFSSFPCLFLFLFLSLFILLSHLFHFYSSSSSFPCLLLLLLPSFHRLFFSLLLSSLIPLSPPSSSITYRLSVNYPCVSYPSPPPFVLLQCSMEMVIIHCSQ